MVVCHLDLTHCGWLISYGDIDLGQHWLRKWLIAWWYQAITWINVEFLLGRIYGIQLGAISQWVSKLLFCICEFQNCTFKITTTTPSGQWVNVTTDQEIKIPQFSALLHIEFFNGRGTLNLLCNMIPWTLVVIIQSTWLLLMTWHSHLEPLYWWLSARLL